ncbi:MAG: trigger factor [Thermoguttaceae bacterium]|nr:trigger factor [Thermoguttaceae bacterium]MDW8037706.1 trigger factor [Thermoguttaceae bacterium]
MSNVDDREVDEQGGVLGTEKPFEAAEELDESELAVAEALVEQMPPLRLEVQVEERGPCQRHILVKVSEEDIKRYFDREIRELMPTAQVPGFRPGRAPRKLVERRYRKELSDRIKATLIMKAISQVSEQKKFTAIGEPEFDIDAIILPEEGPLVFEFELEVRPEFPLPEWKGLVIEKPVCEFGREDVDQLLEQLLARWASLVPYEGPAKLGDYLSCDITVQADGEPIATHKEQMFRLRRVLSFPDGRIEGIDQLLVGARPGDRRQTEVLISDQAPSPRWRGQKLTVVFEVREVKRVELPELTQELLGQWGFSNEGELRDALLERLQRQLEYHQRESARRQISQLLTQAANWELPEKMLQRQSRRELERIVLELQRSGFTDEDIRAHVNLLQQRSLEITAQRLREHFILERIAEEEKIEATEEDYQQEISLIAMETGETPRRVRARLEKAGLMDVLRNQVIENKVIQRILEHAQFKEVPYQPKREETFALAVPLTGPPPTPSAAGEPAQPSEEAVSPTSTPTTSGPPGRA